jgi:hypothetical protein
MKQYANQRALRTLPTSHVSVQAATTRRGGLALLRRQ